MTLTKIEDDLLNEIEYTYSDAQSAVDAARGQMVEAAEKSIACSILVEKAKQMRKGDYLGYLSPVMPGHEVKRFLSIYSASRKRPALHDKRQMEFMQILQPLNKDTLSHGDSAQINTPPPSIISTSRRFWGKIAKAIDRRGPPDTWEPGERQQIKDILQPLQEFINSL